MVNKLLIKIYNYLELLDYFESKNPSVFWLSTAIIGWFFSFFIVTNSYIPIESSSINSQIISLRAGAGASEEDLSINEGKRYFMNQGGVRRDPNPKNYDQEKNTQKSPHYQKLKRPGDPSFGAHGEEDGVPDTKDIPDFEDSINDPIYWNKLDESENEENQEPPSPTPNSKLSKEGIAEHNYLTKSPEPFRFDDWEGIERSIYGRELKKTVYHNGIEAGTSPLADRVDPPVQDDPTKYQRVDCSKITDQNIVPMREKIVSLTTSKNNNMIKYEAVHPYYDVEVAVTYLDVTTGEAVFYHKKNGKFWSYKKYSENEVLEIIAENQSTIKWPKDYRSDVQSESQSEL